jgi:RNA polymerase sigma-54 factor
MVDRSNTDVSREARDYVREKLSSALRLIKSLEERQRTIYKVARSIVNFQRSFLDFGFEHLRPLVLRDVADDIQMHESTVSRVVNNKYMHTPRGLFEMKFFFHSGIASIQGEDVSSLAVKERIKKLVAEESNSRPLSDSALAKILAGEGLQIARRTVAKYREELRIPSSNERRQGFR